MKKACSALRVPGGNPVDGLLSARHVLKLRLETIKSRNDNAMEKFYRLPWFPKVVIFWRNVIKRKNQKNDKFVAEGVPALRVVRAGTKLTVPRALLWRTHTMRQQFLLN